jgi:4-hydroxy-3-methylbut-2-enyl diphosphate reductase
VVEQVVVVAPRGFCGGVVRAIEAVEHALATSGPPVYVRRAIVHNARVVRRLEVAGAVFVRELDRVPAGALVVLSAHGVGVAVLVEAAKRGLRVIDATCPLVTKVHDEVQRYRRLGLDVVLVGHRGHDEVEGTLGQASGVWLVEDVADVAHVRVRDAERVACVTQTTLSDSDLAPVGALRVRFPSLVEPPVGDVCYATRNRQTAVVRLARQVDLVLVVGDSTSSNSRRLCEVARAAGTPTRLVAGGADVVPALVAGVSVVGVAAGASTPEDAVREVVDVLCWDGASVREERVMVEDVSFRPPRGPGPPG